MKKAIGKKTLGNEYLEHIRPISKAQLEGIRKRTSKYVFTVGEKAQCENCYAKFETAAKHKSIVKCPNCHKTLEVWNTKRKSVFNERKDFMVLSEKIDNTTILFRYVLVYRQGILIRSLKEVARYIADYKAKVERHMELDRGEWKNHTYSYFREYGMGYCSRTWCCLGAIPYGRNFFKNIQSLDTFQYLDLSKIWQNGFYISGFSASVSERANIYEKLQKVGMDKIVSDDLNAYYYERLSYDSNERELHKILKLTKENFNLLKKYPNLGTLRVLQKFPTMLTEQELKAVKDMSEHSIVVLKEICGRISASVNRVATYINTNTVNLDELSHYHTVLARLGYDLHDLSYSLPKDFKKEDIRVAKELEERLSEIQRLEDTEKSKKIKAISEALKNCDEIKKYTDGTNGLMIYVPESAEDLRNEGKALHNCIGTYVDRVANQETMVFFIRKLADKNAPFVAFEYKDGRILQCRYDHNKAVERDSNIYNFAEAFANVLRERKVA